MATSGEEKAREFAAYMALYPDWTTDTGLNVEGAYWVRARRGDEILWVTWVDGKITRLNQPTHTLGGNVRKLKNASEARKVAALAPGSAAVKPSVVATRPARAAEPLTPTSPGEVLRLPLPFALDDKDEDIASAIVGRTVTWKRRGVTEPISVTVTARADKVRIYDSNGGTQRIVSFFEERGPQYDIYLSAIVDVT